MPKVTSKRKKRPPRSIKQPHPGKKCLRNKAVNPWEELKSNVMLSLTSTARQTLDQLAESKCISRSELVERIARIPELADLVLKANANSTASPFQTTESHDLS